MAIPITFLSTSTLHFTIQGRLSTRLFTSKSLIFLSSNLTIGTGDVNFDLQFDSQTLGTANLNALVIKPGNQTYPTQVHFQPSGGATQAGATLLENYISGIDSATTIQGTTGSSPIDSLKQALSEIRLSPVRFVYKSFVKY